MSLQALLSEYPASTPGGKTLRAALAVRSSFKQGGFQKALEDHYHIIDKEGSAHRIQLNDEQREVANYLTEQWQLEAMLRAIILKARQIGMSTLIQGIALIAEMLLARWRSQTVAHLDDLAGHLIGMRDTALELWDEDGGIELAVSNASAARYHAPLASQSSIVTARNLGSGRGRTINFVHASEVAFYPNAETLMGGLLAQVPKSKSMVFMESTANGAAGYFFERWNTASDGQSRYRPFFFAWFRHAEYTLAFSSDAERRAFARSMSKEETELEARGVNLEQLHWRRMLIRDEYASDPRLFQQEYPSTPEEAFLTSGRPTFDPDAMAKLLASCRGHEPSFVGYLQPVEEEVA